MNNGDSLRERINGWGRAANAVFGLGLIVSAAGLIVSMTQAGSPRQFFQAYLFAYVFWIGFSLGSFALTLLHHVVRGTWGLPILRILEAGSRTLPLMAFLFVPIAIAAALGELFPWSFPEQEIAAIPHMAHAVHIKHPYLNVPFFLLRAVIYFTIWIAFSRFLNRSSLLQDRNRDESLAHQRTNWSAPGIVVFVITITFAFTDWVMALDPRWFSTVYGFWFVVGQALSALALAVLIITRCRDLRPFSEVVTPQLTRDLGNLLLTLTMLWAYLTLSQWLIMWSANLPEEVLFYTTRNSGGWLPVGAVLVCFQFFAPFLMLLSGRTKRTPNYLANVAILILVMRVVDMAWTVIPFYTQTQQPTGLNMAWMSVAAWLLVGGLWLGAFTHYLRRNPLLVRHDPRLQEAVAEHA